MEQINLLYLYGAAREQTPNWAKRVQELPDAKRPKNTRAHRKMILDLEKEHRSEKKNKIESWMESGSLDNLELLDSIIPLVYQRLKKVKPADKDVTGLPTYNQQGIMSELYYDSQASYYQEFLLQEAYYVPCQAQLKDGSVMDPIILDFPPLDSDLLDPDKVVEGGDIQGIAPSGYRMAPDITKLFIDLKWEERGPSECLVAKVSGKRYLVQDASHGKSPLFFKCGDVTGAEISASDLERTMEPGKVDGENEWTSENTHFGLFGVPTLEALLKKIS